MDKEQAIEIAKRYKKLVVEKLPVKALYIYMARTVKVHITKIVTLI